MIAEFEKTGRMSWFSHLDLQSTMQRALRRAGLPVRYSQGFNPHVNLSFATALSVGLQSTCEILDVELQSEVAPEKFLSDLNACLPEGLKARRAGLIQDSAPALMALMEEAAYAVTVPGADLRAGVAQFLAAPSVLVEKRSKTKTREVDIRPMVRELTCAYDGETSTLRMILEQNNANCLKPELLLSAIAPDRPCRVLRTGFYAKGKDGGRIGLFEAGLGQR
jgi:radical SAM-linked protein